MNGKAVERFWTSLRLNEAADWIEISFAGLQEMKERNEKLNSFIDAMNTAGEF